MRSLGEQALVLLERHRFGLFKPCAHEFAQAIGSKVAGISVQRPAEFPGVDLAGEGAGVPNSVFNGRDGSVVVACQQFYAVPFQRFLVLRECLRALWNESREAGCLEHGDGPGQTGRGRFARSR